jgi:metal-sulfur cluster biosynthetic enzyme
MDKSKMEQQIIEQIKTVDDPEIPVDIYELGLI